MNRNIRRNCFYLNKVDRKCIPPHCIQWYNRYLGFSICDSWVVKTISHFRGATGVTYLGGFLWRGFRLFSRARFFLPIVGSLFYGSMEFKPQGVYRTHVGCGVHLKSLTTHSAKIIIRFNQNQEKDAESLTSFYCE